MTYILSLNGYRSSVQAFKRCHLRNPPIRSYLQRNNAMTSGTAYFGLFAGLIGCLSISTNGTVIHYYIIIVYTASIL